MSSRSIGPALRAGAALLAALLFALTSPPALAAAPKAKTACSDCHDLGRLLPAQHKPVKGKGLRACISCHEPDPAGPAEANAFSSRLHRAHAQGEGRLDCLVCHVVRSKGAVAVVGDKVALPTTPTQMKRLREVALSWAGGSFLDAAHGRADVDCRGCHGGQVPDDTAEVDNARCLSCHGPMERLVEKTRPAVHEDRNPHASHLGEIACTVCHKGHAAPEVYCLDCHKKFEMKLPSNRKDGAVASRPVAR